MQEPSVLDYFLAKIQFWKKSTINFDQYLKDEVGSVEQPAEPIEQNQGTDAASVAGVAKKVNWAAWISSPSKLLLAIIFALLAQSMMEIKEPNTLLAGLFYLIAAAAVGWALYTEDLQLPVLRHQEKGRFDENFHLVPLLISLPFMLLAFITFGSNRFTVLNGFLWLTSFVLILVSFWKPENKRTLNSVYESIQAFLRRKEVPLKISWWHLLLLFVAGIAFFFRFYLLDSVPGEMFSDHAEKLLDVQDVLEGQYSIFFPRNTGREAFQMYLTAFVSQVFGTGISFLSLKIGTILCSLAMLPYIYLIGKEVGNRRVGLYALIFASIAYWPNVISRVGLRFILYAFFTAPTMYYLLRGLRGMRRNDFILCGIFLGLGLHGYSSFRFVPLLVLIAAGIYWLHQKKESIHRKKVIGTVLIIALVAFVIFLPLFRFALSNMELFTYRMATRMGTAETDYPGNPVLIFLDNFWDANMMMWGDNGTTWVHSVLNRPALDLVTAAFYFFGFLFVLVRYVKHRNWEDLFILISIPLLLMPSILSLAFPVENPSLNRTSAAMVPVFVVAGMGMEGLLSSIYRKSKDTFGKFFVVLLGVFLFLWSAGLNYDLVFNQYQNQFMTRAWNTSDIGEVIAGFSNSIGTPDSAYVVPYMHWVDTRLVGINAGQPRKDYALWREGIPSTLDQPGPKLFIFKPEDGETMEVLSENYPNGQLKLYDDQYDGRDFYIFLTD